jgi:hypothetical protein
MAIDQPPPPPAIDGAPTAAVQEPAPPAPASPPAEVKVEPSAPAAEPAAEPVKAEPAKAEAAKPEAPKPEHAADKPSLLETFDKDAKDAKAPEKDAAKPEAKPGEPPAEAKPTELAPIEYKYQLPETLKLDDAGKTELHSALDAFRTNPADGAQGLVDLHNKRMQDFANHLAAEQHRVFNATRESWRTEVMADPELGGAGHQTTMGAIARVRDALVPENERVAFDQFLRITGAGDNPVFLRMLHRAVPYIDEPQASKQPLTDIRPPKNNGRAPKGSLYTHPSSKNMEA